MGGRERREEGLIDCPPHLSLLARGSIPKEEEDYDGGYSKVNGPRRRNTREEDPEIGRRREFASRSVKSDMDFCGGSRRKEQERERTANRSSTLAFVVYCRVI